MSKPTIAITVGDPSGIGPEIAKKAVSDKSVLKICNPVIIGTSDGFTAGKKSSKSGESAVLFLKEAVVLLKSGKADALVTGPVSKSAFVGVGGLARRSPLWRGVGGHTEFFAKVFNIKNVEMLMVSGDKKVFLLTRHIPLKDVSKKISKEKIVKGTESVCGFIKKYFGIKNPKIIVCGLNPHCGDNGLTGNEEKKKIIPAIKILKKKGFNVSGPVNSEAAFKKKSGLIVCMYHDQAMVPLKLLNADKIVNVTVGLPFIRTSPGHGTAYDIAGKGVADCRPMVEAIKLAARLTKSKK